MCFIVFIVLELIAAIHIFAYPFVFHCIWISNGQFNQFSIFNVSQVQRVVNDVNHKDEGLTIWGALNEMKKCFVTLRKKQLAFISFYWDLHDTVVQIGNCENLAGNDTHITNIPYT